MDQWYDFHEFGCHLGNVGIVPLAVGKWYDFHEYGLHLGNVESIWLQPRIAEVFRVRRLCYNYLIRQVGVQSGDNGSFRNGNGTR